MKKFCGNIIDFLSESRLNHENIEILNEQVTSENTTHAYLFSGESIRHLLELALMFFAAASCPDKGCGTCASCKSIFKKNNPNMMLLEAAGPVLTVEEIESLLYFLNLTAYGNKKGVVIVEADLLNDAAANKLLKTLEEPPNPDSLIILLSEKIDAVLGTILSRCQIFKWDFKQALDLQSLQSLEEIKKMMNQMLGDMIHSAGRYEPVLEGSKEIIDALDLKSKKVAAFFEAEIEALKDSKMEAKYIKKAAAIMTARKKRSVNKFLNFGINYVFDIIIDWLDDLILVNAGAEKKDLNFPFHYGMIKEKNADPDSIIGLIKYIDKTRLYLNYSINRELALDCILLQFLNL